jgi:aspartyl aminopeptidase
MGIHNEFLSAPRLDNLASSFVSLDALIDHKNDAAQTDNADISMLMLFDHEEIGSTSAQGANSNLLSETTHRLFHILKQPDHTEEDYYRSIHKSLMVSADMAHAIHPNYPGKHQSSHSPMINYGIVFKTNANQRYMTDSIGASIIRLTSARQNVPIQDFIVKNDSLCGSTIGPMMAAKCGMKTIDIGAPQLGMHSIRETCGAIDLLWYRRLFTGFWKDYHELSYDLLRK